MNWTNFAACRGQDTELWFPVGAPGAPLYDAQVREAKAVCLGCPVATDCLLWALDHPDEALGVWGGTDEHERAAMLRQLPAQVSVA